MDETLKLRNFLKERNIKYKVSSYESIGAEITDFKIGTIECSFSTVKGEQPGIRISSNIDADNAIEFLETII